jgi:DNA-binding IclR family transcriptional regulator
MSNSVSKPTGPTRAAVPGHGRRGIQSVEVGGRLLHALAHHGRAMALKDLAADAGMPAARAHPYLVSFGHIGLVEQERDSGRYALGPLALQLGLISLQQVDPVRIAAPLLPTLAARIGQTVALVVWGSRGPTIVLREASPAAVHVDMRHGTVFSIAGTASGRLFAAHLPADVVRPLYEAERREAVAPRAGEAAAVQRSKWSPWARFERELDEVRRHGLGRAEGAVVAGVSAMSAPVFDHRGAMVLAITAIGPSAAFDVRWSGGIAAALRDTATSVSARLGHAAMPVQAQNTATVGRSRRKPRS